MTPTSWKRVSFSNARTPSTPIFNRMHASCCGTTLQFSSVVYLETFTSLIALIANRLRGRGKGGVNQGKEEYELVGIALIAHIFP